jgi:hypothetical protein
MRLARALQPSWDDDEVLNRFRYDDLVASFERTGFEIKRGENAGRKLRNANVVRSFERLGTWTGARLEIPLDLAGARARGRDGCAVIVQQGRAGPVLAAAAMNLGDLGK